MLRGRKILSKKTLKKQPIIIEEVVPVIASSLAGTNINILPVLKTTKTGKKGKKTTIEVSPIVGSKKPATIFMIIVLILGFYVIYDQFINEEQSSLTTDPDISATKIDDTKDYVYYENEKEIYYTSSSSNKYIYKDIVININTDSVKSLTTRLNAENAVFAENYENDETEVYECLTDSSIYSAENSYAGQFTFRDYAVYESNTYITIVIINKNIDRCGQFLSKTITTYVVDKTEGIIYTESSLLTLYETTKEELITKAISGRTDGNYATLDSDQIVANILHINDIELYIDTKDCLGVYYTGIMYETSEDKTNISVICK